MSIFKRTQRKYVKKAYRVRNWREYEAGLRNRGSLTVWISLTAGKLVNWDAPRPRRRKPGRQRKYSNHAIETAVTLGMVFHLSSRQSEGLLANPTAFFGQQVTLQGMTTQQLSPGSFLFSDGTGSMPVDFQAPPFPVLNSAVSLQGTVVPGTGDFAARINVTSFDEPARFSCDDIIEVRARFSDPGFVAGDVVGLYLAYRGTPPGEKILEVDWDEHSGSPVDRFEVGEGTARDGLFDLEGVVGHEYNVSGTETKNVRANLFIEGRSGSCSRVRDVTVTKGSGPGFAAGGALRLEFDDPVLSGGFFSVTATVNNVAGATADAILHFSTPDGSSIRKMGNACEKIGDGDVECIVRDIEPGSKDSEFVQYNVPSVTKPTVISGSVTLVARDFSPVAHYSTTVEP